MPGRGKRPRVRRACADAPGIAHSSLLGWIRCEATEERAEHSNRGWRHPRDPGRLAERLGLDLRETLNDFPREPRHARERELRWYAPPFVAPHAFGARSLLPEITGVLDGRLHTGDIERAPQRVDVQRYFASVNQLIESHFGLFQHL